MTTLKKELYNKQTNVKHKLELKACNEEITRLRKLVDFMRNQTILNNKEFLRIAQLPDKIDPLKFKNLMLSKERRVKEQIKYKMYYKWRNMYKMSHLRREAIISQDLMNWRYFVNLLTNLYFNVYKNSFPDKNQIKSNSFVLFKKQIEDIKNTNAFFILSLKPFYVRWSKKFETTN